MINDDVFSTVFFVSAEPWRRCFFCHLSVIQSVVLWFLRWASYDDKINTMMIMMMMMITMYRTRIYPCCNSMLIALERPQSSSWLFLLFMVRAGYLCLAIIHPTLTWSTESLSCAQMVMHAIARGVVRTLKASHHLSMNSVNVIHIK